MNIYISRLNISSLVAWLLSKIGRYVQRFYYSKVFMYSDPSKWYKIT